MLDLFKILFQNLRIFSRLKAARQAHESAFGATSKAHATQLKAELVQQKRAMLLKKGHNAFFAASVRVLQDMFRRKRLQGSMLAENPMPARPSGLRRQRSYKQVESERRRTGSERLRSKS